jgi:hypothetical protein
MGMKCPHLRLDYWLTNKLWWRMSSLQGYLSLFNRLEQHSSIFHSSPLLAMFSWLRLLTRSVSFLTSLFSIGTNVNLKVAKLEQRILYGMRRGVNVTVVPSHWRCALPFMWGLLRLAPTTASFLWQYHKVGTRMSLPSTKWWFDKFNYLRSLLECTAYETIYCLTLSSANYREAINIQLNTEAVTSEQKFAPSIRWCRILHKEFEISWSCTGLIRCSTICCALNQAPVWTATHSQQEGVWLHTGCWFTLEYCGERIVRQRMNPCPDTDTAA